MHSNGAAKLDAYEAGNQASYRTLYGRRQAGFCQHSRQPCRRELREDMGLCGTDDCERSVGTTEMKWVAVGKDILVVSGAEAEEVAKLVMTAAEAPGGGDALGAPHASDPALDAAVAVLRPWHRQCGVW